MTDASKNVFISYRRSVSKYLARLIFDRLRDAGFNPFLDVNSIDSGAFDNVILNQIRESIHFVVLISPRTLERCKNEGDWLRREIEEAMRLGLNVVPMVEDGVEFIQETEYLPEHIRDDFRRYNSLPLTHYYFDAGIDFLINRFLKLPNYQIQIAPTVFDQNSDAEKRISQIVNSPSPTKNNLVQSSILSVE